MHAEETCMYKSTCIKKLTYMTCFAQILFLYKFGSIEHKLAQELPSKFNARNLYNFLVSKFPARACHVYKFSDIKVVLISDSQ